MADETGLEYVKWQALVLTVLNLLVLLPECLFLGINIRNVLNVGEQTKISAGEGG